MKIFRKNKHKNLKITHACFYLIKSNIFFFKKEEKK